MYARRKTTLCRPTKAQKRHKFQKLTTKSGQLETVWSKLRQQKGKELEAWRSRMGS